MDLTPRGTYGKLNALGTQSGLTARNSYNFRAATGFSEARPFPIPPAFGVQRVPSRRAVPMRADFLRPSTNWNLARGSTMPYFNIHPYEFFKNSERQREIRDGRNRQSSITISLVLLLESLRLTHEKLFSKLCSSPLNRRRGWESATRNI